MQLLKKGQRQVRVLQKYQESEDVCSFELASLSGESLPMFTAGAHVDVHINGFIRQYSLCNDPATHTHYRIAVLRDRKSLGGSIAMHGELKQGDILTISDPRNHFSLCSGEHHTVLMAGGIGITPLLSMAYDLQHKEASFELHYSARSKKHVAFFDEISTSAFAEKTSFHFDDGCVTQKLNSQSLLRKKGKDSHFYMCGPTGFLDFLINEARNANVSEARMHREYFVAPSNSLVPKESDLLSAFEIMIASTGKVYVIEGNESITQGLLRQGIDIPVSCEQGVCGTCLTKVLEGVPDHRDFILTSDEHINNKIFTPCCSRSKSPRLILDL